MRAISEGKKMIQARKGKKKAQRRKVLSQQEANAITLRNRTESPLLRLPGEIHNRIYDYIFSVGNIVFRCPHLNHRLSVPSTCRQIHSESSLLLLKNNQIKIKYVHMPITDVFLLYCKLQPQQRDAVKALRVVFCKLMDFSPSWTYEGVAFARELRRFVGFKRVEIEFNFGHKDAAAAERQRNEFCDAVRHNIRRHVQVTCA